MVEAVENTIAVGIDIGSNSCRIGTWKEEAGRHSVHIFENSKNETSTRSNVIWEAIQKKIKGIGELVPKDYKQIHNCVYDLKELIGRSYQELQNLHMKKDW